MKKSLRATPIFILFTPLLWLLLFWQSPPTPVATFDNAYCATDALHQKQLEQDTNLQLELRQLEQAYRTSLTSPNSTLRNLNGNCVLPVVVHIIENGGLENISDMQVELAIQQLNDAFANINYYNQGTGVDTEIQFCLARQDPDGLPSSGINRINSTLTNMTLETQDIAVKNLSRWNPLAYVNVWLVRSITSVSSGPGVAGYAYFPTSHGNPEDGIVMEAQYFGSSAANTSVLVHEMGHYLGLYHTFQDGCANNDCLMDGDRVCDTPPDQSTAAVPCTGSFNSCSTDTDSGFATDQNDMFWNYMDYGDLNCYSAFTQGQTDRMQFSVQTIRFSLLDSKGCQEPCPDLILPDFTASATQVLVGTTVNFTNTSTGTGDFEWQINDDAPFATTEDASYTFNQTGQYWVYLTVAPGDPLCERTDSLRIKVALCGQNAHVSNTIGVDAPGCGDPANMCQTIQYALDNIVCDNDTVFIHSGTYNQPGITPSPIPVVRIPQGLSITLFGVDNNGPVIIDGNNQRQGVQYNYPNNSCQSAGQDDGIDDRVNINFANLTFQNCFLRAFPCGSTTVAYGGAVQLVNNNGSELYADFFNCQFWNNLCIDPDGPNNHGRPVMGAAIYFYGAKSNNASPSTEASIQIDSCLFVSNRCEQLPNGGIGGAVTVFLTNTATLSRSSFCNNSVFSENADDGDLQFSRNGGGAVAFRDNSTFNPGHVFNIDESYFIGNTALTADGANLPNSSGPGGAFLVDGTGPLPATQHEMRISNSFFYDNSNEDGQFHYGNNTGDVIVTNTITNDDFLIDLGNDTSLCNSGTLVLGDTILFATYTWSTGEDTPIIIVDTAGVYSVTVTVGECQAEGEIVVFACEECDNGIDDDGDGLVDCNDPDLQNECCCLTPPILDLGPDLTFCATNVVVLDAGPDFATYRWQDGFSQTRSYTAWLAGTYWVDVTDSCGNTQSDTITITIDPAPDIELGNDTIICEGESVVFSLNGFASYQWAPLLGLDCSNCPTVTATPPFSTTYQVFGVSDNGCVSTDTVRVFVVPDNATINDTLLLCAGDTVSVFGESVHVPGIFTDTLTSGNCEYYQTITVLPLDTFYTTENQTICAGDSLLTFSQWQTQAGTYTQSFTAQNGCDSLHTIELVVLDTFFTSAIQTICANETADIFGAPTTTAGNYSMTFTAGNGCDSTHLIQLNVLPLAATTDTIPLCPGDSTLVFGMFESAVGDYSNTFTAANGCDSTHTITLLGLDDLTTDIQTLPSCTDTNNGEVTVAVAGGLAPYTFTWVDDNTTAGMRTALSPGTYPFTVTDAAGCQLSDIAVVTTIADANVSIAITDAVCFGTATGSVTITSSTPGFMYSLDGSTYTDALRFENLLAGAYTLFVLTENDCESTMDFFVSEPVEPTVSITADTLLCLGDSVQLISQTNLPGPLSYTWDPPPFLSCTDCPSPFARPLRTTPFLLSVMDTFGCSATTTITLEVEIKRRVYVPNVFSPNNDGFNDIFYLFGAQEVVRVRTFKVFDRWGELIFEDENFLPNSPQHGWDGTFRGRPVSPGVFVWFAEIEYIDGVSETIKGDVTIVR